MQQTFLFRVTPTDPITFTIVTLLLMVVGLMAAWLPLRRVKCVANTRQRRIASCSGSIDA